MTTPPLHSHIFRRLSDSSTVHGQPEHVRQAQLIDGQMRSEQEQWIAGLRTQGVKAAHPDDGWVNRERNTVHLCYPQFDDGAGEGDIIALGWPGDPTRLVRLVRWEPWRLGIDPHHGNWHFVDA